MGSRFIYNLILSYFELLSSLLVIGLVAVKRVYVQGPALASL
jgi:hypothetical protein